MPIVELPQGGIHYRSYGPADSTEPPVVFVHGLLVDGLLWAGVADRLAEQGIRSYALDLPLGSHTHALRDPATSSPRGVARLILDVLAALDLTDVTLVGNDTGGALCQFTVDTDVTRIGRLLLTNCDAFDQFPPAPFSLLTRLGRRPWLLRTLLRPTRWTAIRHSLLGYGGLVTGELDPAVTAHWARPCLADRAVARDTARFLGAVEPQELVEVAERLGDLELPVVLLWGDGDRFFRYSLAERLQEAFADARLVRVPGGRTFLPLDVPDRVAKEIVAFTRTAAA